MNDEAHHVHDEKLKWHETIMSIHNVLPAGLTLWLDFTATPKTQTGIYYPWIIVDYPLAQAVEDRIVKALLIVHRIDKGDPEKITTDDIVENYADWIIAALERWKEHYEVYQTVNKKPVLFIMTEKSVYADKIAEFIQSKSSEYGLSEDEILCIHTDTSGNFKKDELDELRTLARNIDKPTNKIKIIVSVLMLREGWNVQNVTVCLGLRPFSSKARILPEQAVGRGLRLIRGISPDYTQTLEVMGTSAFEEFVKELEEEGVGINTTKTPPPLSVTIAPEKSRLEYDIEIPQTELCYDRNYKNLSKINPLQLNSLYSSEKLDEDRKMTLQMDFTVTDTEVHRTEIDQLTLLGGRELISYITQQVIKKARLTAVFSQLYPIIEIYILKKCFEVEVEDIEDERLRKHLSDTSIQEAIIDLFSRELGQLTAEKKPLKVKPSKIKLSEVEKFLWRRIHPRCEKTVFNFVAVFNNFEAEFAEFLDKFPDIEKFAALAYIFKIDYLSSRGAIRFYFPDFIAIQKNEERIYWIIETKGREFEDSVSKDIAIKNWCENMSKQTKDQWKYLKVLQRNFDQIKKRIINFSDLVQELTK